MALSRDAIVDLYRRRARRYDFTANLYYLIGFREWAYRRRAVARLGLQPADTVVEVGCGTGLNFRLLEDAVGPLGRVIGVDLTDAMLEQARRRVEREGWRNVELVHADAARYEFPRGLGGILSTFALLLVPEFEAVIERGARSLLPGRRWVVADLGLPDWPGARLVAHALVPLYRPFAVTLDLAKRRPGDAIALYLTNPAVEPCYFGFAYVASGEAPRNVAPEGTTPDGSAGGGATMATDPVCGMQIEEAQAASKIEHEGRTFYFCSETCQKVFERMPERFVGKK